MDNEELTEPDIKERVGTKGITSKAIRELWAENKVFRKGEGKRGSPYFYRKTPSSKNSKETRFLDTTNKHRSRNLENLETSTPLF